MGKRLNDTQALRENSMGVTNHTVSSRKIDNGYVVNTSSYNPSTGEYKSSEQFMSEAPRIVPANVSQGSSPDGSGSLSQCMRYMRDKG